MIIFFCFAFIELGLVFLLKRQPYPRLWVIPLSQRKWEEQPLPTTLGRLPQEILTHLLQKISMASKAPNFNKALQIMDAVRNTFPFHIYDTADFDSTPGYLNGRKFSRLWEKKKDLKINCGTYSHVFLRLCQHFAIPARMILMSDRRFQNNHVLSEVWDDVTSSWVLMDILYDAYFVYQGKKLSAVNLRSLTFDKKTVEVKRGNATLDWYCTPERILDFFQQGLVDFLFCLSTRFSFYSRFLHRAYFFNESIHDRWWIKQKVLQFAVLALPVLFLCFVLRHG